MSAPKRKVTLDESRVLLLRKQGLTSATIATRFGVSRGTIRGVLDRALLAEASILAAAPAEEDAVA